MGFYQCRFLLRCGDMDTNYEMVREYCWLNQIGNLGLQLLWHILHFFVSLWHLGVGIVNVFESFLISSGLLSRYKTLNIDNIRYLAIVIDSEDAHNMPQIIQLLRWLAAIGLKQICLYDVEGILKRSKESILEKLGNAVLFEEASEKDSSNVQKCLTLEFASASDGKEAVAKAANVLFAKYTNQGDGHKEKVFTEAQMTEALRAVGCKGPDPDLLLVWGPTRCHLGFPAFRMRYTEIVHMGPLKSMKYGSMIKAIYQFTRVHQNYGT